MQQVILAGAVICVLCMQGTRLVVEFAPLEMTSPSVVPRVSGLAELESASPWANRRFKYSMQMGGPANLRLAKFLKPALSYQKL